MENSAFHLALDPAQMEIKVRFSIFTIIGACAGLPALVWAVSDLIHHRKNGQRISIFIIFLLFTDFVELFLSPYMLLKYLLNENFMYCDRTCIFFSFWLLSRDYGRILNQLVALEGILSVRFPVYTASVFSSPYVIIFYIHVFICFIIIDIRFMQYYHHFIDISVFIVSVIRIISCSASCSADRHSQTSRKPDHHILVIFIFTLLVLYLPITLISFYVYFFRYLQRLFPVWHIPWILSSLRLISDPLLCVLVCRQDLNSQKPDETSLV